LRWESQSAPQNATSVFGDPAEQDSQEGELSGARRARQMVGAGRNLEMGISKCTPKRHERFRGPRRAGQMTSKLSTSSRETDPID
jgi:hypothetical protein